PRECDNSATEDSANFISIYCTTGGISQRSVLGRFPLPSTSSGQLLAVPAPLDLEPTLRRAAFAVRVAGEALPAHDADQCCAARLVPALRRRAVVATGTRTATDTGFRVRLDRLTARADRVSHRVAPRENRSGGYGRFAGCPRGTREHRVS